VPCIFVQKSLPDQKNTHEYIYFLFGPQRDEVTGGWRKLLHNLHSSPSIIRIIKSRRMRLAGHVARMEEKRNAYGILVRKPRGKKPIQSTRGSFPGGKAAGT
jgi:hypothetical protein